MRRPGRAAVPAVDYLLTFDGLERMGLHGGAPLPQRLGPQDLDAVMARCEAAWRPHFEAWGWSFRRGEPVRDEIPLLAERVVPAGRQRIAINFSTFEERLSVEVLATIEPELPEAVLEACGGPRRMQVRGREYRGIAVFMVDQERGPEWLSMGGPCAMPALWTGWCLACSNTWATRFCPRCRPAPPRRAWLPSQQAAASARGVD
jgi:hypothetical protein